MDMVLKIMNKGNTCFQHLKGVTSPFIKFLYSLATKPDLVQRQAYFVRPVFFICHPGKLCSFSGCFVILVTVQGHFLRFCWQKIKMLDIKTGVKFTRYTSEL